MTATNPGNGLFFEDVGDRAPHTPVVVIVHGAMGSSRVFEGVLPLLSGACRVVAPDLRGMGQSGRTRDVAPTAWTDDLRALLTRIGAQKVHLIGSSLGARVVLRFALSYPACVASLTLDAPMIGVTAEGDGALVAAFSNPPPAMQADFAAWQGPDWPDIVQNFLAIRQIPGLQEHLSFDEDELRQIACPTLITRGDQDDVIHPIAHALTLHRSIAKARLWIAPNTRFAAIRQRPRWFAEIYKDFLAAIGTNQA